MKRNRIVEIERMWRNRGTKGAGTGAGKELRRRNRGGKGSE